jgi:RNA polymerase sigma-70 factor (ECF subfamily)
MIVVSIEATGAPRSPSARTRFHAELVALLPALRGSAFLMTRSRADADDLLQQTAIRAIMGREQFTLGTNMKAWLYRIMRNEFIESLRKKKRSSAVSIEDFPNLFASGTGPHEDREILRHVLEALEKVPVAYREVLILFCTTELSYEEIAEVQGCSIGTIKSRIWRARQQIQRILGTANPEK